ncbi:DUF2842 domain-containing protein [Parvularcula flava]|uniref:DUF2842 domain-containing protein n=1 Tax=Aquisalinus luteolus TaxID=1566827 RepID=A0A8J3A615_9PROT|nr:DUF2842 domain-containing protein [Aquisalinus luteolus]NHK27594.1 DUF2842 domain-containing protein [Aquisalinus luteolus]GGH95905.1 hypothetical protein GCM10011355_13550 [Aquisalinus luteolus]
MNPRTKKLIGLILFLPALLIYAGIVVTIADYIPNHWAVYLVYYIIMGTIWAFPLKPVMAWMNRPVDAEDD